MTAPARRTIRRSKLTSSTEVLALIQSLMVAELVAPSACLWIVSPWVSDIPVIDNTTAAYNGLVDRWGPRNVRLSEVLVERARRGASLVLATRLDDPKNAAFLAALRSGFTEAGLGHVSALRIAPDEALHEKGIAGDDYYLSGSMNLTWTGVHVASEVVQWTRDAAEVQRARRSFSERYGGDFVLGGEA